MKFLFSKAKKTVLPVLLALLIAGLLASPAAAKKKKKPKEEETKESWVVSYAFVGLGLALGMAGICRPGRRQKDVKR